MKRVTLKTSAVISALDSPDKFADALAAVAAQLMEISNAATEGVLDLTISLRGSVLTERPGVVVAALGEIDSALGDLADEPVQTDLTISNVRESRAKAAE